MVNDPNKHTLQWVHIDDFSPGCFDNTFIATEDAIVSAPVGGARADKTFCCASIPSGGLGPLPALSQSFVYPNAFPGTLGTFWIVGFIVNPGLDQNAPEIVILIEGDDGTDHYYIAYSTLPKTGSTNVIVSVTSSTTPGFFGSPYPVWTRMSASGSVPLPPALVFPAAVVTDPNSTFGHVYVYPDLSTPTVFSVQDLVTPGGSTGGAGQVIAYGSRIIVLNGIDYPWPSGAGINTNENIDFTDPPQSSTYPNQQTILGDENPWGYGAWGTQSVGELLLVKKYGGGIILNGDIAEPSSVITIPAIESTGAFVGKAESTPIGLIYCSQNRGAWSWNGGNTAQKISSQMDDDFFDVATALGFASNNYGFFVAHWQDWILFSNNRLFNPDTGGWWTLYPNEANGTSSTPGHTLFHYSGGALGNEMYAAPLQFLSTDSPLDWYYMFDSTIPAPHWQWTSLPIHVVKNANRVVDVRQIILRLSDPTDSGNATATVTCGGFTETISAGIGPAPTTFRLNVGDGALGLTDIVVQVNGDNALGPSTAQSSPILHSLDIGFAERASVGVSD